MSFAAGETGIERGATKVVFAYTPTILERYAEDGPPRAVEITLPGTPVQVEYLEEQNQPYIKIDVMYIPVADLADFLTLVRGTGPLSLKTDPAGSAIDVAVSSYTLAHVTGGDYPDDLDSEMLAYRAQITFIRL